MKILVTGGAGFIGSNLVDQLLTRGHTVFVLDDLSTGSMENLRHLERNKRLHVRRGSVLNPSIVQKVMKTCDQIYHLAAAVGVKRVVEKPLESFITNTEGTRIVLELASKDKTPVLITSSSEVYGKNGDLPFCEGGDRVFGSIYNERWGYALSKASDEFLGLSYWRERKSPTVVVRLFNTTGPRQVSTYGMVVPTFVQQALASKPITVHGDGKQVRSFSYVDDIVRGMISLMNNKKAYGEVCNLGSDEPISINALAQRVKKTTQSKSPIIHIPYAKAYNETFEDMRRRVPDISKARKLVGYKPTYTLDKILAKIIAYHSS